MSEEGRMPESGQKTENRRQREQIYTGESYERDARLQKRKIGSLVQSEELGSEERSSRRRLTESENQPRRRAAAESESLGRRRAAV